ncbi:MAG: beta-L-arabinofuranosidase domain-containing protein, partial [Spirochaetia bacterium]
MEANQFRALPLKAFTPAGWTRRQLEIQAAGLSGHLDEFWPDIKDSGWIGGNAEGWERAPYWLDGLVPLAYLLADSRLIRKVTRWMDYILEHQHQDGWLGPSYDGSEYRKAYDPWPQFIILKVLSQYREVSGDNRVIPAMVRNIRKIISVMKEKPLESWAKYRWAELLVTIRWLDGRPGVPADFLREAAETARAQGFDWPGLFRDFPYTRRTPEGKTSMETHVVNNAMALKGPALDYLYSGDIRDAENSLMMMEVLDNHHGQITGMFTGDEHLAGKNPSQGTELCAVTEYLFSLEILLQILGSSGLGDRLEQIAFNALPAAFRDDMNSHQYDQQVNQVICTVSENKIYTTNSGDANIFGLEPNYG